MNLIITEFAVQADGTFAIEILNTGGTDYNIQTEPGFFRILVDVPGGQSSELFFNGIIPAGETVTYGHSSISGLTSSPDDAFFSTADIELVQIQQNNVTLDHFGVEDGPSLGTDVVYEGSTSRSPDTDPTNDNTGDFVESSGFSNNTLTPCFLAGTRIETPTGTVAVEDLKIGDMLLTADGRAVPLLWLGRKEVRPRLGVVPEANEPVCVMAGALGAGRPTRDLRLTADHGLSIDGYLINAGALVNGSTIDFMPLSDFPQGYTVYHLETEDHDVIIANGTHAETFIDAAGRKGFDNYQDYLDVYGVERIIPGLVHPRVSSRRLLPQSVKDKLRLDVHQDDLATPLRAS